MPFVQEIVGIVTAQFHPFETAFVGKGEVFFDGFRAGIKTKFHMILHIPYAVAINVWLNLYRRFVVSERIHHVGRLCKLV
jgi:hypothetical protein